MVTKAALRTRQTRALGLLALAALACIVRLALPVGVGLFLGALLAFTLQPLYEALQRRRWHAGTAAVVCALGATTFVSSVLVAFSTLLVTEGLQLLGSLAAMAAPGGALRKVAEGASGSLAALHVDPNQLLERIQNEVVSLGSRIAGVAAEVAGMTFGALLALFFMTLSAYYVVRHWSTIVARAEQILPFERRHTHALLDQFRTVGRQVLLGTVVTGIVQGVLSGVGFWLTGTEKPAFFGALTALASLVPAVGTLLIWVPIGVVQLLAGHPVAGLVELVYSTLTVVILSDYVIRPRLVGQDRGVPTILTFVALFGGVEVFGVVGLILGPVLVTLSVAVLRTYAREVAEIKAEAEAAPTE